MENLTECRPVAFDAGVKLTLPPVGSVTDILAVISELTARL